MENVDVYDKIISELRDSGCYAGPRGMKTKEILGYNETFSRYDLMRFPGHIPHNVKYIKEEFKWYFRGLKDDLSICYHASIWKSCVNEHGLIQSNYGAYLLRGHQLNIIIRELTRDPYSRRAQGIISNGYHRIVGGEPDVPCTMYIGFAIRNNVLNMFVRMRSQDFVYGIRNDFPFWAVVWNIVLYKLNEHRDLLLDYGTFHYSADSLHIYEKHFNLMYDHEQVPNSEILIPDLVFKDLLNISLFQELKGTEFARWLNETEE